MCEIKKKTIIHFSIKTRKKLEIFHLISYNFMLRCVFHSPRLLPPPPSLRREGGESEEEEEETMLQMMNPPLDCILYG